MQGEYVEAGVKKGRVLLLDTQGVSVDCWYENDGPWEGPGTRLL